MRSGLTVVVAAAMLACACTSSTAGSQPARLFVAPNGNDGGPGSLQRPLRTLQRAVDRARPGTTVYVRGGRHAGFRFTHSGRPGAPITIKAYSAGRRPVIRPLGVTTNVIELRRVHDVVLEGLTVTGAPKQWGAGVRIDASSAIRVARMTLIRNRSYGLKVKGSRDVRVTRNVASSPDRVYSIDSALPATVQIDRNLAFNPTGGWLGYVFGHGNTRDRCLLGLERVQAQRLGDRPAVWRSREP